MRRAGSSWCPTRRRRGCSGGPAGGRARERLRAAIALARRGAVRGLIVLVGTPPDFYDERAAVLAFARRRGVTPELVVTAGAAHSTMDDARLAAQVMRARGWRRGGVVTSAYHTRRAGMAFCRVWVPMDLQVSTYAAEGRGSNRSAGRKTTAHARWSC